jgi:hypothetical protein
MRTLRLRQAVVAARDRDAVVAGWTRELGLGVPFHDPGVARFGLCNSVVPVGDTFLEVVTPTEAGGGSAAERYMNRHGGDCGYMAIFQVEDMDETRAHLQELGVRTVLDVDLDDIRCTHAHPADIGAAIVSFDQAVPEPSWRWAGPDWPSRVHTGVATAVAGLRIAAADPASLLSRWATVLAVEPAGDTMTLDDGSYVTIGPVDADGRSGITGIDLWAADGTDARAFELAGVRFRLVHRT